MWVCTRAHVCRVHGGRVEVASVRHRVAVAALHSLQCRRRCARARTLRIRVALAVGRSPVLARPAGPGARSVGCMRAPWMGAPSWLGEQVAHYCQYCHPPGGASNRLLLMFFFGGKIGPAGHDGETQPVIISRPNTVSLSQASAGTSQNKRMAGVYYVEEENLKKAMRVVRDGESKL